MRQLPSGTVTFLFTDVEGSTLLLAELGAEAYAEELQAHRVIVREAFAGHGGVEVDTQGDSFFVAFHTPSGALAAAAELTARLESGPIRVRVGIHTGTPLVTEEGYVGADVHRAARIGAAGHGGQVLVSAATAALVERDVLRDLGEQRFKDLAAPERVFQLGESGFPPLRTLSRTNLPVPATAFLGRDVELGRALELLGREDVRLVSLTGPGGTGKTRLGLQAAAEVADAYPDGVWWVPLASIRDPELALGAIAGVLGVREGPSGTLLESVRDSLHGRRALLLLDNAEHLLPGLAVDVEALLGSCPGLKLVVTSRERLQLRAEHELPVPSFALGEAVDFFRLRVAAHGHELGDSDAIRGLCIGLDALPLALELAAARVKVFSPEQLLQRLGQRLDLLKGGRDADPRQQTLRATIEWSHELLGNEERRLFRELSVFLDGCTFEAAETVCGADPDTLQSLLDKSLLSRRGSAAPRYWMLETIREYAAERLAETEAAAVRRRHGQWYVDLTTSHGPPTGVTDFEGVMRIRAEHANIRAALEFLLESDDRQGIARVVASSWAAWLTSGFGGEGASWARLALERKDELVPEERAHVLAAASELMRFSGNRAEARELKLEIVELERNDPGIELRRVLCDLADMALEDGDTAQSLSYVSESLELARSPRALASLGDLLLHRGELDDAEEAFAEARDGFAGKHEYNHAWTLLALGEVARRRGDSERACAQFDLALQRFRTIGDQAGVADALDAFASVVVDRDVRAAGMLRGAAAALREEWARPPSGLHDDPPAGLADEDVARGRTLSIDEALQLTRAYLAARTGPVG